MNLNREDITKHIIENLPKNTKSILNLSPRFGKTRLMIEYIKKHKFKSVLWVTPFTDLATSEIPLEFKKWKANSYLKRLQTCTWSYLPKVKGNYDLIILDELQKLTELNSTTLLNGELSYNSIIGMTGTPTKHKHKIDIYDSIGLEVFYDLSIEEAVDNEILSDYEINVVYGKMSFDSDIDMVNKKTNKPYKTSEYKRYYQLKNYVEFCKSKGNVRLKQASISLLNFIKTSKTKIDLAKKLFNELEGKTIIFTPNKEICESISKDYYHSTSDDTSFIKFQNDEIEKIALVNKGGIGSTYRNVKNIIIVQCDSDKTGLTSQKICRGLLKEHNKTCVIWLLCLKDTVDEEYVKKTLSSFNSDKIKEIYGV